MPTNNIRSEQRGPWKKKAASAERALIDSIREVDMKTVINYLRADEWISSKVTMMLGMTAYFICINEISLPDALLILVVFFLFISAFLAISYVSNDFSDMEADKKAGKEKIIAKLPRPVIWLSLAALTVICVLPVMLYAKNTIAAAVVLALTVFLGTAYSMPGIRFKEKGLLGLIECSFAQHCMPMMVLWLFLEANTKNVIMWVVWFVLSFANGLRYILIHQYIDRENDRISNVHTYVSDKRVSIKTSIICFLVLESVCCIGLCVPLFTEFWFILVPGFLLNLMLEFCIYEVLNVFAKKDWLVSFDSVPLEALLNFFMPLMFGACMMKISPWMILFCAFVVICCWRAMRIKLGIAAVYVKSKFFS